MRIAARREFSEKDVPGGIRGWRKDDGAPAEGATKGEDVVRNLRRRRKAGMAAIVRRELERFFNAFAFEAEDGSSSFRISSSARGVDMRSHSGQLWAIAYNIYRDSCRSNGVIPAPRLGVLAVEEQMAWLEAASWLARTVNSESPDSKSGGEGAK
jgi:hypothetical protein